MLTRCRTKLDGQEISWYIFFYRMELNTICTSHLEPGLSLQKGRHNLIYPSWIRNGQANLYMHHMRNINSGEDKCVKSTLDLLQFFAALATVNMTDLRGGIRYHEY